MVSQRDIPVGTADPDVLIFDLDDPEDHYAHSTSCSFCIRPTEITTASLKNILKVGIEFRAIQVYTGTVKLDNVTVGGLERPSVNRNRGFVRRDKASLVLNGQAYRFTGNNVYYLLYKSHYMIDDVFETMQRNGMQVVRTWGFSDGKALYAGDGDGVANGNEGCALQPEPRLYYEPTWVKMDYVIQSAGEHGIRLILPLVNHWSDLDVEGGRNGFGGMGQYLEWCGVARYDCGGRLINKAAFITDPCAKQLYKDYIHYTLNRENSLTHIHYKDDPTILAWELANEPRCQPFDGCPGYDTIYDWASGNERLRQEPGHKPSCGPGR